MTVTSWNHWLVIGSNNIMAHKWICIQYHSFQELKWYPSISLIFCCINCACINIKVTKKARTFDYESNVWQEMKFTCIKFFPQKTVSFCKFFWASRLTPTISSVTYTCFQNSFSYVLALLVASVWYFTVNNMLMHGRKKIIKILISYYEKKKLLGKHLWRWKILQHKSLLMDRNLNK